MTRVDLQNRLNNQFGNPVYYDTQSVNDSIQDGLDEICAYTGCIYKSAKIPFTRYTTYYDMRTLLPDYVGIVAMWNNTIRRWMFPSSMRKFDESRIDWDTAYGTPRWFSPISHRYVAIFMKPGVVGYGDMIIFYRASAPLLVDSTPIPLPDEHLTVLESFSTVDLWEQAQEWGKAEEYFQVYAGNLEDLRVLMRNKRNSDRLMGLK